jgi:hypothetical protein
MADEVATTDLVIRIDNTAANVAAANSWATFAEMEQSVRFRMDVLLWNTQVEDVQVRAMVMAYKDLTRLTWRSAGAGAQNRDHEFPLFIQQNEPPTDDVDFIRLVKEAQSAQTMFILAGTQVRDMAREGVRLSRSLKGAEMEFTGYKGAVCTEAKELLAEYIVAHPRMRRMA